MGSAGSHIPPLPSLPSRVRRAAITQALGRKFDKRKRISRTFKRIIHYNSKHPNKDQCKLFKELVSAWTTAELSRLVEIYESTITLQQVTAEASSARCTIHTAATDLQTVLDKQICTDVVLKYRGCCFPCHRIILAARSTHLRKLLLQTPYNEAVDVASSSLVIDSTIFLHFLNFLYSDSLPNQELITAADFEVLCQQFGVQSSSRQMLTDLHLTSDFSDVSLVFLRIAQPNSSCSTESVRLAEYPCHSAVLASRSELLRNLICRRIDSSNMQETTEIVLNDSVVSHKYAPLLLKIMYQDILDLSLVNSQASATTSSSLSEAQAIVAGRSNITLLEETMELHHIGNFLELPILIEKCEDYIVQSLCPDNLHTILSWSQESSGSKWVYRETLQYIQDNFMQICKCPALYNLDECTLAKVLQSDFLQASEFDVLQAIINWSEHQLIRRLESREPNLVTHTAHSLVRKGIKSKDLDSSELREVASPLMLHVRQTHLLSSNPDVITSAVKRGLIGGYGAAQHRSDMAASEPILNNTTCALRGAWVPPTKSNPTRYDIPRAYMPFYDLARSLLDERTRDMSESDVVHLRRPSRPNPGVNTLNRSRMLRHNPVQNMTRLPEELSQLAFGQQEVDEVIKRTHQLLQTGIVVQALQGCWDKSAVLKQVCLWAVRELGYADQIIYTINNRTQCAHRPHDGSQPADLLSSSLVPDLAPERLILQHGLSSSYENLTIHSVNSSPDVTLLSLRSYRPDVGTTLFPDVTLHSHSSTETESSPQGAAASTKSGLIPSLQQVRRRRANTTGSHSLPHQKQSLPELLTQHKPQLSLQPPADSGRPDPPLQPDVLGGFPPSSNPDLMPTATGQSLLYHASTLDSRPRRACSRTPAANPYHTPPRTSSRRAGSALDSDSNLLYSSLTRNMNLDYMLASAGPPPDIAPQPSRRMTGTSTPPDITSSPSNTWQAML